MSYSINFLGSSPNALIYIIGVGIFFVHLRVFESAYVHFLIHQDEYKGLFYAPLLLILTKVCGLHTLRQKVLNHKQNRDKIHKHTH